MASCGVKGATSAYRVTGFGLGLGEREGMTR